MPTLRPEHRQGLCADARRDITDIVRCYGSGEAIDKAMVPAADVCGEKIGTKEIASGLPDQPVAAPDANRLMCRGIFGIERPAGNTMLAYGLEPPVDRHPTSTPRTPVTLS